MSRKRSSASKFLVIGAFVVLIGVVAWGATSGGWFEREDTRPIEGAEVRRGPLTISVIERGNLKAADSVSLKSEVEGNSTILYLIKEGEHVTEGTLLCELDATQLVDKKFQQEISVRNAEAAWVESKQNLEIQKSQNESDIATAEQTLDFAKQDLKKYREGDMLVEEQQAREEITLKSEEFARASEEFDWSQKLADKGFLTTTELEADRLAQNRAKILFEQAERQLKLLIDYEFPREIQTLEAALREAERELERVKLQAAARLVDYETAVSTNEAKLKLEQEKLSKLEKQIAKARIIAPRAGMVVYAKQDEGGRGGGNQQPIQEGTSVRERQEIITIPNASGMIAQASLHESVLRQVAVGMPVEVKVDALRDQVFKGSVKSVAVLPDQNSWWANPNLRLFRADIAIDDPSNEMRPGMSCQVEILCEVIHDTTYVPVQSVFRHRGENVCFVAEPGGFNVATVQTGQFNEKWVEIKSGVQQGQRVLLALPEGFKLESGSEAEARESDAEDGATAAPTGAASAQPPAASTGPAGPPSSADRRGGDASGAREGWGGERASDGSSEGDGERRRGFGRRRDRDGGEGGAERGGDGESKPADEGASSTEGSRERGSRP